MSVRQAADPRWSATLFALAVVGVFVLTPLVVNSFVPHHPYFGNLASLAAVAAISILAGFVIPSWTSSFKRLHGASRAPNHIGAWGTFAAHARSKVELSNIRRKRSKLFLGDWRSGRLVSGHD